MNTTSDTAGDSPLSLVPFAEHIPPKDPHFPPTWDDPLLLRIAKVLTESIKEKGNDCSSLAWEFAPSSPDEDLPLSDPTPHEQTVVAVHRLVQQAVLPIDTSAVAALILSHLEPPFYAEWYRHILSLELLYENTKEAVVIAALMIAQKHFDEEIYDLPTWFSLVLRDTVAPQEEVLKLTMRLIHSHIHEMLFELSKPVKVDELVRNIQDETFDQRYFEYLRCVCTDSDEYLKDYENNVSGW